MSVDSGHFLMGCDGRVWAQLLRENGFAVARERIPQALLITAVSQSLRPVAALERWLYDGRIRASKPTKDPLFILGNWRSGTTYLQNMLSRDPQFGWFDPVNTVVFPYSQLLGKALTPAVQKGIASGRPMDNVQYDMSLPMEETFALLTQTTHDIIHLIAFPANYEEYLSGAFVEDLSPEEQRRWAEAYDYVLRKLTYAKNGKRLVLKSPDNTCHIPRLLELYPDARFVNIHRDPYRTVASTIRMFTIQMEKSYISAPPENAAEIIEEVVLTVFERMYRQLFALQDSFRPHRFAEVAYADFCREPVETLRRVYDELELPGFARAEPEFAAFRDSQKNYKKNELTLSPALIEKINARLGFYMDYYGYERKEAD